MPLHECFHVPVTSCQRVEESGSCTAMQQQVWIWDALLSEALPAVAIFSPNTTNFYSVVIKNHPFPNPSLLPSRKHILQLYSIHGAFHSVFLLRSLVQMSCRLPSSLLLLPCCSSILSQVLQDKLLPLLLSRPSRSLDRGINKICLRLHQKSFALAPPSTFNAASSIPESAFIATRTSLT